MKLYGSTPVEGFSGVYPEMALLAFPHGKPVFLWNLVDLERLKWGGPEALPPGRHTVEFDRQYDGLGVGTLAFNHFSGVGGPGVGTLEVGGKVVATQEIKRTLPMILQWDESFAETGAENIKV